MGCPHSTRTIEKEQKENEMKLEEKDLGAGGFSRGLDQWIKEVHETAVEKGWWSEPRPDLECHMLMVSEIAEATEEYRKGTPPIHFMYKGSPETDLNALQNRAAKPEGEAIELADCVIRIMDYFGSKGWSLEEAVRIKTEYNKTRGYRHGNKKA